MKPPKNVVLVVNDFCPEVDAVRASALNAGFGTWRPGSSAMGAKSYDGMGFAGLHSPMLKALSRAIGGRAIFPNSTFFRVTTPETENAFVHSDRAQGDFTCVAYLSEHEEVSGTAFFRHIKSGLTSMPTVQELQNELQYEALQRDMIEGVAGGAWEQTDFVRGLYNRAVIFDAPLFHSRFPYRGIGGADPATNRLIWASHFE